MISYWYQVMIIKNLQKLGAEEALCPYINIGLSQSLAIRVHPKYMHKTHICLLCFIVPWYKSINPRLFASLALGQLYDWRSPEEYR